MLLPSPLSPTKASDSQLPQVCGVAAHGCRCKLEQFGAKLQLAAFSSELSKPFDCFTSSTVAALWFLLLPSNASTFSSTEVLMSGMTCTRNDAVAFALRESKTSTNVVKR
jgi:hypothetical protein